MKSTHRQIVYAALAVVGLFSTWYFNIQFMMAQAPGASWVQFVTDSYATHASSSLTNDISVACLTFLFWSYFEAKRLHIKRWWLIVPLTFAIALAVAFPLFLLIRERKLINSSE